MAGILSDYTAEAILSRMLLNTAWSVPTPLYLAFYEGTAASHLTAMTDGTAATMSGLTEVTEGTYVRKAVNIADWDAAVANRSISNDTAITWVTTVDPWNSPTPFQYVALMDTGTVNTGNCILFFEIASPISILNGADLSVAIGNLTVTL